MSPFARPSPSADGPLPARNRPSARTSAKRQCRTFRAGRRTSENGMSALGGKRTLLTELRRRTFALTICGGLEMWRRIFERLAGIFGGRRKREAATAVRATPPRDDDTAASLAGIGSTGGISGGTEANQARPAGGDMFSLGVGAASTGYAAGFNGTSDTACGGSGSGDFGGGDFGGGDCGGGGS
jgi:hypothetical protein